MRIKVSLVAIFIASCIAVGSGTRALAQVAPSARVGGLPIGIGIGFSSYDIDYGNLRMEGPVARASLGLFHGIGIDASARSIFMFTPSQLTRMQQTTLLGGVYYEAPLMFHVRPFVRYAGGLGIIEFPSYNPAYTRDSYTVTAPSGGVEIPLREKLYLRAEYEYQFWKQYHGPNDLTPNGFTLGVTYYLSGMRTRAHRYD